MYTFGYIREATQAHLDIDEAEAQAMHLQERYHIFANEAMQAICGSKPKYDYFKCEGVKEYWPLINEGDNKFRPATEEEINWEAHSIPMPNFADSIDTKIYYTAQNIYLLNEPIKMPDDFIAFADKQVYFIDLNKRVFDSEIFVNNQKYAFNKLEIVKSTKNQFMYSGRNNLILLTAGRFYIPYKAIWFRFVSGIEDQAEIDMPVDIFLTIPLYVASICLEQTNQQNSAIKRAQFERALANCTATDFLTLKDV